MHGHRGHSPRRGQEGEGRIETEAADVVHEVGAGVEGGLRHLGLGGVDREVRRAAPAQPRDHRGHPPDLLFGGHRGAPGARGLAPHVDEVGPRLEEREALGDGGVDRGEAASVGERVGGRRSARPSPGCARPGRTPAREGGECRSVGSPAASRLDLRFCRAPFTGPGAANIAGGERSGAPTGVYDVGFGAAIGGGRRLPRPLALGGPWLAHGRGRRRGLLPRLELLAVHDLPELQIRRAPRARAAPRPRARGSAASR